MCVSVCACPHLNVQSQKKNKTLERHIRNVCVCGLERRGVGWRGCGSAPLSMIYVCVWRDHTLPSGSPMCVERPHFTLWFSYSYYCCVCKLLGKGSSAFPFLPQHVTTVRHLPTGGSLFELLLSGPRSAPSPCCVHGEQTGREPQQPGRGCLPC